ncbi:hypothetical protein TNCV_4261061 [Trichonephila clavipes]|nr:hypothetical protein TNCV_4261061 [Trichonephila clavipes]
MSASSSNPLTLATFGPRRSDHGYELVNGVSGVQALVPLNRKKLQNCTVGAQHCTLPGAFIIILKSFYTFKESRIVFSCEYRFELCPDGKHKRVGRRVRLTHLITALSPTKRIGMSEMSTRFFASPRSPIRGLLGLHFNKAVAHGTPFCHLFSNISLVGTITSSLPNRSSSDTNEKSFRLPQDHSDSSRQLEHV